MALLLDGKEWLDGGRCGPRDPDGGYRGPSSRMVVVDLDCEDEWGEVEVMEADELRIRLGNDEGGYWRVKAAYEFIDPAQNRHENRWDVWHELPLPELAARVLARFGTF